MNNLLHFKPKDDWSENWNSLAALAHQGFCLLGRGIVELTLDGFTFMTIDQLETEIKTANDPAMIYSMVNEYDPERELVALIRCDFTGDGFDHWRRMKSTGEQYLTPQAAYELLGDQGAEPGPVATVHRLSDWSGAA